MNSPAPLISVIITSYNDEAFVARAIESVLNQTYQNFEILLVDNNSTDGTLSILREYQQKHPDKIRVFEEKKQGCPVARNRGVREARGEWIQILDSDDEILPKKLEHQIPFTYDENVGLIVGNRYKNKIVNGKLHQEEKCPETENIWKALLLFKIGATNSCLWRRVTVLAVNGWNESWTSVEDYEMFFRVIKKNEKIAFSPFTDAIVHMRENSMSRTVNKAKLINHIEHAIRLRLMVREYMKENHLLSPELESEFEVGLYLKLLHWQTIVPDYIKERLKELNLRVPAKTLLKYQLAFLKGKASGSLKNLLPRRNSTKVSGQ